MTYFGLNGLSWAFYIVTSGATCVVLGVVVLRFAARLGYAH